MVGPAYLNDVFNRNPPDWTLTEAQIRQALAEHPEDELSILHILHLGYYMQSEYDECLETCQQILTLSSDRLYNSEVLNTMAFCYAQKFMRAKAVEYYLKAIEADPDQGDALNNLGELYIEECNWDKAIETFEWLLKNDAWHIEALENLAYLFHLKQDYNRSITYYQLAMQEEPEVDYWTGQVGKMHYLLKEYDQAEIWFAKQLAMNPASDEAYYGLGSCKQEKGDFYLAMHNYAEALRINPEYPRALNNIGKLYFDFEGDIKKAIEMIEKAIACSEEDDTDIRSTAYLNLKRVYKKLADDDKVEYYHIKFMECLGFTYEEESDEEDNTDEEEPA
jgi:tetratricopeptide (TPR) repeat protein